MIDSAALLVEYPGARFHAATRLVTWFPIGALTNERADGMVDFLESQEKINGAPFHRFTDMTGYTKIELGLDHIVRLARRRRGYRGPRVKSALYATRLVTLNIARMYEELMQGSRIQVCIFADRAAAAEWLGVKLELLRRPREDAASLAGQTS